ncbi:MAG: TetR/AcrR family transcriptional regulator [Bacteroidia bacterium]|nr:TetR/AcrR family transcriptional regulator [Bacteroidia bacterium]MCX7652651.1 TetR/AcrR family transcriptional regulator [Bacteroidia bacterium]MDW8416995.1 TetR/AcrR family transcriptional regulator [Bacteroidia bacterium]
MGTWNFLRVYCVSVIVRDAIIATAQKLFIQQGVRATTMDQIAEQLGISKKTLYEHFGSKDSLVEACVEAFLREMENTLDQIHQAHSENALLPMIATASYVYSLLISLNPVLYIELRRVIPHARAQVLPKIQALIQKQLTRSVEKAINEGIFRSDLPMDILPLWMSFVIVQVVLNPALAEQAQKTIAEIYAETILLLLYSFTTERGRQLLESYKNQIRQSYVR